MNRWIARTLLLTGAAFLLSAAASAVAAAPPDKMVLQLKWRHQFQFAGYYAAQQQGYYRDEGLAVEIREGTPGNPSLAALLEGRAHVAVSDSEALLARMRGKPVVALAVIYQHSPFILLTRSWRLNKPSDLAGRTVMINASQGAAELKAVFAKEGIPLARVRFVEHS